VSKERRRNTKRRTVFVAIATAVVSISIPAPKTIHLRPKWYLDDIS